MEKVIGPTKNAVYVSDVHPVEQAEQAPSRVKVLDLK